MHKKHRSSLWAGSSSRRGGSDLEGWTRCRKALLWKHPWSLSTKSFSFFSFFSSSLWQPDPLFFSLSLSLLLTLHHSHCCISVAISSRENEICDKEEKHIYQLCHLRKWKKCVLCLVSLLVNRPDSVCVACRFMSSAGRRRFRRTQFFGSLMRL